MSNDDDRGIPTDAKSELRISKQDFLNQVFGEVGTFIKDYHCVLGGKITQYGRIYATDRFLIFYSKSFGREKKIMIHFSQIKSISQSTGVFRSIIVETVHRSYNFHSFWEPDKSFYYLNEAFERFKASAKDVIPVEVEDEFDEPEFTISCAEDIALLSNFHKKVRVIKDTILPISLNDFLATFVEDSAVHSYQMYHELVNDKDIEMSPWIECGANEYQRELKFMKPVNLPGLASTRGVKYQQLRRPSENGFILTSSTRLEDVPCADCFSVDDVLIVHAEGTQAISINISFEVAFAKSTLMRSFIEGPTEREMKKWLEAFFDYVQDIVLNKKGLVRGRRSSTLASNSSYISDTNSLCTADSCINPLTQDVPFSAISVDSADSNIFSIAAAQDSIGVSRTTSSASNPPSSMSASNYSSNGRSTVQTDRDVPVNKSNETKQEFLYSLFGPEAGILYKDYHCALVGTILIQGRIYATDKAILFYSIIFGREKALMIPFSQIKNISHPQGVLRSIIVDTDSKSYTFRSFWEPEKSFHSLEVAWEKAKQLQKAAPENNLTRDKRRFSLIDAPSDDSPNPLDMLILNEQNNKVFFEKYALDTALREKVDTGGPLPISFEEFMSMFMNDGAPYGYDHFYESMNNATPSVSAWSEIKPGEYQREIQFLTSSSLLTFGSSRGVKSQYRVNLCDNGILVKSSTHLEDISFSTYFTIEEVMLVHRGNTNHVASGGDSVVVHLSFDIQLLKGSFVRPLVFSVTAPELRRWLESYIKYMRDSVNQKKGLSPKKSANASGSPRHSSSSNQHLPFSGSVPTNSQQELSGHYPFHSSHSNNSHTTVANNDAPVCDINKKSCPIAGVLQGTNSRPQTAAGNKDKINTEAAEVLVTAVAHQYRLLILLYCTITLCFFLLAILIWNRNQVHALHKKVHHIEELMEMLIKQELDSSLTRNYRS